MVMVISMLLFRVDRPGEREKGGREERKKRKRESNINPSLEDQVLPRGPRSHFRQHDYVGAI